MRGMGERHFKRGDVFRHTEGFLVVATAVGPRTLKLEGENYKKTVNFRTLSEEFTFVRSIK